MIEEYVLPNEIEKRSFEIIEEELGQCQIPEEQKPILKRVIHTTADFDYVDQLVFSPHVVQDTIEALKRGTHIVTDTQMTLAGVSKTALEQLGGGIHCFISDSDVAREAKEKGTTRAVASMYKAAKLSGELIFAIGNAPTALLALKRLIEESKVKPQVVIGVPVGFVNVVESKEEMMRTGVPYIVACGRKGGSNVAAAICNALLYAAIGRRL